MQGFNWAVLILFGGVVVFGIIVLTIWLAHTVTDHRDKEALTAADLRMLEESVETLIQRLKAASDEAVSEIEVRQRELQALLDRVDKKLAGATPKAAGLEEISTLVEEGLEEAEISRRSGLSRSEVELLLEMQASRE